MKLLSYILSMSILLHFFCLQPMNKAGKQPKAKQDQPDWVGVETLESSEQKKKIPEKKIEDNELLDKEKDGLSPSLSPGSVDKAEYEEIPDVESYKQESTETIPLSQNITTEFAQDYFDRQEILPGMVSGSLITFFQNDYELPNNAKELLEKIAYTLALGEPVEDQQDQKALETYRCLFAEWFRRIRPKITLIAKEKKLQNDIKRHILQTNDHVTVVPLDRSKIKKIEVELNQPQCGFNLKTWVDHEYSNVAREENVLIELKKPGRCVTINPRTCDIYVGCEDGLIRVFDINTHRLKTVLYGHTGQVEALDVICDGRAIISSSHRTTYVWAINDNRPRLFLEDREHSKTYLTNKALIRSHLGGKTFSGSFFGNDGVYQVPEGYLYGEVPGDDLKGIAFFYLLKKLNDIYNVSTTEKTISDLFNSYVCNTFEPPITKAIKQYLKERAKFCNFTLVDKSLDAIQEG